MIKNPISGLPWICLAGSTLGSCIFIASQAYTVISQGIRIPAVTLPIFQLLILGCYLGTIYIFRNSKNILLSYLSLLAILCIYFLSITNQAPLGDHDLLIAHAFNPNISIAEPIPYFLYKWIIKYTGDVDYLNLIPPLFGILSASSYFLFTHTLSKNVGLEPWIFKASLLAMPLPFFYTYGYIENTQLSTPFLIMFLYSSLQFLISRNGKIERVNWCCLSLFLSIAILIHGQNWFVMAVIFLLPLLKEKTHEIKKYAEQVLLSIILFSFLLLILYKLSIAQGWQFFAGSSLGGGDGLRFVPIYTYDLNKYATFTMFSLQHATQISTIMVFSGLYTLATPFLLLYIKYIGMPNDTKNLIHKPVILLLALTSLGYLGFIAL